jgi:hypothetical protein
VKVNVEPMPTWLLTQIRPPCSSTNFRDSARPSPVPFHLPGCRADLPELLEDRLVILGRDPDAGVADRHLHASRAWHRSHVDSATLGRELDGIRQQVEDDLAELPLVRPGVLDSPVRGHVQRDAPASCALVNERHRGVEHREDVHVAQFQLPTLVLDLTVACLELP